MSKPTKYEVIRVFNETYSDSGIIDISPSDMVKSFTIQNEGAQDIVLNSGAQTITILPNDSYIFGGFDNSVVSEFINFTFSGAGTKKAVISRQKILGKILMQDKFIEC